MIFENEFNHVNIFASPDVEVVSADIPALVLSDHRPYIVEINF